MPWDGALFQIKFLTWFFILVRVGAFMMTASFWGSDSFPKRLRAYLSASIAYFLLQAGAVEYVSDVPTLWVMFFYVANEVCLGLILGFTSRLVYLPIQIVGMQVGRSCGFGQGQIINPNDNSRLTVLQHFLYIFGILLFFCLDGHLIILRALMVTFTFIPLGGALFDGRVVDIVSDFFAKAFGQGISFAAPMMGAVLIGTMCFGILGKSVPQMNLLIIDLPVRIIVGLTGVVLCLPMIGAVYGKFIYKTGLVMERLIGVMSLGRGV